MTGLTVVGKPQANRRNIRGRPRRGPARLLRAPQPKGNWFGARPEVRTTGDAGPTVALASRTLDAPRTGLYSSETQR